MDISPDLLAYVQGALQKGMNPDRVKSVLVATGWEETAVDEAIVAAAAQGTAVTGTTMDAVRHSKESSEKDAAAREDAGNPYITRATAPKTVESAKKRSILSLVVVGSVLLFLGAGSAAAYQIWYKQIPEVVLGRMVSNLFAAKSFHHAESIELTATGDYGGTLSLEGEGAIDKRNEDNPLSRQALRIAFATHISAAPKEEAAAMAAALAPSKGSVAAEMRFMDKTLFLQLTEIPVIKGVDTASFLSKWISIPFSPQETSSTPSSSTEISSPMSPEKIESLRALVLANPIFAVSRELPVETIGGRSCRHYGIDINKENIKTVVREGYRITTGNPDIPDEERKSMGESFAALDATTISDVALWIGKSEDLPCKAVFSAQWTAQGTTTQSLSLAGNISFSSFNTSVGIEKPESARSIQDVAKDIFMGFAAPAAAPAPTGTKAVVPFPGGTKKK